MPSALAAPAGDLLPPLMWLACVLSVLAAVAPPAGAGATTAAWSQMESCAGRCPFQNKTDDGLMDAAGCGADCRIQQCGIGCNSWQRALQTSCQTVCNGTRELLLPKELYCVMGCNDAVNMYFQRLREEIGVPPAPALVADSLTAYSLSLEWDGLAGLQSLGQGLGLGIANLSYLVQWRYEELAAAWQYCRNQSWGPHATARVDNLQPYSKYRFRVALLLPGGHGGGGELLVSAPSVVISTLASGTPASPPTITRATAVDWGRVSVSWQPGRFPNGPLLSYVLRISELPAAAGDSALKDIPAAESSDFYMFQNLLPGRNYSVSVAMRNGVGEGPAASAVVSTPPRPAATVPVDDRARQPALVLAASRTVTRQAADLLDEPAVVYRAEEGSSITGIALHIAKRLLFVSDSSGNLWRAPLSAEAGAGAGAVAREAAVAVLSSEQTRLRLHGVSVDWLNNMVYVVGQVEQEQGDQQGDPAASSWQVARAGLDGRGLTVAVAGLPSRPLHVQVDPYNGFLFWVLGGARGGGLYRLDLAEVSNGIKHETRPSVLLEDPHLGAFVVDHANFRLLVPHHANNTVLAVSLDGREVADLRRNTQQAMFQNVVSLAFAGGLFYWTDGREVLSEEYHAGQDAYFHNTYPNPADRSFVSVCVDGAASQPVPIPVNPPTAVQAVLGAALAKASWQAPHLLGGQGRGAWQDWQYVLSVRDEERGDTLEHRDVNATWCTVHGLREDTPYVVRAAAYTSAGVGPWSSEFRARTLRSDPPPATVLWAARGGLLRSDVTGDHVEVLVQAATLRDGRSAAPFHAAGLAWWRDRVYLVANTSLVYAYNLTSRDLVRLPHLDGVGCVAVDWVGQRLYWSNPKQQLITRGNLLGGQQEPLPILTVAKELVVDADKAFLYWSTGHGVESARLNGKARRTYYPAELFSGKHVMGLALARDSRQLYWVVRSYEGSALFRASTADQLQPGQAVDPVFVSQLSAGVQGPLSYFSHHLLWLRDDRSAVIGDLAGQNAAVISGNGNEGGFSLAHLHTVTILDPEQQRTTDSAQDLVAADLDVIPKAVAQSSIRVTGSWEAFNISWNRVTNVNFGQVLYELKVRDGSSGREMTVETAHPSVRCCGSLGQPAPYAELDVAVRALTYWGASTATRARLHSPAARPREPHNPRVFVTYNRDGRQGADNITALFRWDPPRQPNGPVHKYLVKHWYSRPHVGDLHMCEPVVLPADRLEFAATLLELNCTYYFQVQAFTEAGSGASSAPVSANTGIERPVPRLLIATVHALVMEDCDRRSETMLLRAAATPVDLDFLHAGVYGQGRVLWLSETHELRAAGLDGRNKTKLAALTGSALGIAVDWVERAVYWSELEQAPVGVLQATSASLVRKLYLDREGMTPVTVLRREGVVRQIAVSPLNSTLIWVEDGTLMTSAHDGSGARPFFSRTASAARGRSRRRACTCPKAPRVGPVLSVDHSLAGRPRVLWVNAAGGDVVAADLDACACAVLVGAQALREAGLEAGLPPSAVTADGERIYWANASLGRVYSSPKQLLQQGLQQSLQQGAQASHGLTARELSGVRRITALGAHLQPYPDEQCLVPMQPAGAVSLVGRSADSVLLRLPAPRRPARCADISLAPIASTLYYGRAQECGTARDLARCRVAVTYDDEFEVVGLEPYTDYAFVVAQANYYSTVLGYTSTPGELVVFRTAPGAPTPPRDVRLRAEDPGSVRVWWRAPEHPHAAAVWYELLWRTEGPGPGARTSGQDVVPELDNEDGLHTAVLTKLSPGQSYAVWVRAHAQDSEEYSDSAAAAVRTLPEPGPLVLLAAGPHWLRTAWTPWPRTLPDEPLQSCALRYCEAGAGAATCRSLAVDVRPDVQLDVRDLQPKTNYTLRLEMTFPHSTQAFLWPVDSRFTFQTLGDRPGPPGTPSIQHIHRAVYQVTWLPSEPNGSPVETYNLQGWVRRKTPPGQQEHQQDTTEWALRSRRQAEEPLQEQQEQQELPWETFYNGSDNFWIMSEAGGGPPLLAAAQYVFRVRALNEYGWSNWSGESRSFDLSEAALLADQQELGVVLGIAIPVVLALCFFATLAAVCVNRRREQEKKALHASGVCVGGVGGGAVGGVLGGVRPGALDVELATLRELPRRGNFVHRTNTLYAAAALGAALQEGPTDEEVALLPHIRRHQITLTKFLGSGAFGEVFEGNARNLGEGVGEMRVAIKTLRKGATELEKAEFLKEAQLMSHFRHAHILQLLGVCLDNDPNFIIMELMEGGDLLSYLRCRRPQSHANPGLSLQDLLGMCVDVARGCRYLEEMHFVHRDLACRNCLVSGDLGPNEGGGRVVKIGDFGLARDIYKNDYYRKEGEGLLPVRWMAPESLMDGVFTCQSDVWAFGVLVWEVMTLGQQPYPARTNIEVLHYVRAGGRLGRPANCPEDLHQLMLKCWLYSPEARPTFKYCLQILEDLKAKTLSLPIPPLNLVNGGVANRGYFEDENHNSSGDSWKTESDAGSRDRVPFLSPTVQSIPKYLELIYDGETTDHGGKTRDGYEVPRPPADITEYSNLPPGHDSPSLTPGTS